MMNFIKFIFVTLSLFLSSCIAKDESSHLILASTEVDSNFNQNNQGLGRRRVGNQGSKCIDSDDCVDICEDIYSKRRRINNSSDGAVDACTDLRSRIVFEFQDIIDALDDPNQNNLKNIDTGIFTEFVTISLGPWQDKLNRISGRQRGEIQQTLIWLASTPEISTALLKAYKNNYENLPLYHGIRELLKELPTSKVTDPVIDKPPATTPPGKWWAWRFSSCCRIVRALNEPLVRDSISKSFANLLKQTNPQGPSDIGRLFDKATRAEGCGTIKYASTKNNADLLPSTFLNDILVTEDLKTKFDEEVKSKGAFSIAQLNAWLKTLDRTNINNVQIRKRFIQTVKISDDLEFYTLGPAGLSCIDIK